VGLRVAPDGRCAAWVQAGETVPAPRRGSTTGVAWWVRAEAWPLQFAPWPTLAPLAGLVLNMVLDDAADPDQRTLLATRLCAETADLGAGHWAGQLRRQQPIRSLPPCATPRLMAARASELSRALRYTWMVQVQDLQRCDMAAPVELPQGHAETPTAALDPARAATALSAPSAPSALVPSGERAPSWDRLLAEDSVVCRQLSAGLPRLALDLDRRWSGGGWSADAAVAARQRAISQALGLMAAKIGAWPSLAPHAGTRRELSGAERSLVALEALRAAEALAAAEQMLQALPAARTAPVTTQLEALESGVQTLQGHLQARLLPWWE